MSRINDKNSKLTQKDESDRIQQQSHNQSSKWTLDQHRNAMNQDIARQEYAHQIQGAHEKRLNSNSSLSRGSVLDQFAELALSRINSPIELYPHPSDHIIHHKQQIPEISEEESILADNILGKISKGKKYRTDGFNIHPTITKAVNALKGIVRNSTTLSVEAKQKITILYKQMEYLRDCPKNDPEMKKTAYNLHNSIKWYYSNNIANSAVVNTFAEEIGVNPNL